MTLKNTGDTSLSLGKVLFSLVSFSLLLTGCGMNGSPANSGQSEAFKLGYSQAAELNSEKQDDEFAAYAYCTTIAQNIFAANSQQEFDEYVAGCMDYVMSQ
jgi:hypothetical protein